MTAAITGFESIQPAQAPLAPAKQAPARYISGFEDGAEGFAALLELASAVKADPQRWYRARPLAGKVFTALFLDPSLRTRTSMESAMARLGGHMVALSPGSGAWNMEFADGVVMNGAAAEHIKEAAGVLSSYSDALGIRAFARMQDFAADMRDEAVHALARHATVPVVSLESAVYHPCQALADALTLRERFGEGLRGRRFTLTWATHPKMCGVAVPHSALLTAARLGMEVTLAHPPGYELHAPIVSHAAELAEATGGSLTLTHDLDAACQGAHVVYAKAWGAQADWGNPAAGAARNASHGEWTFSPRHLAQTSDAVFMHCLPVRRNVVVADAVLDSSSSIVQQQAANRMWAQMALLLTMMH